MDGDVLHTLPVDKVGEHAFMFLGFVCCIVVL
jgi:energy-converting hydrogenase Eha subunit C